MDSHVYFLLMVNVYCRFRCCLEVFFLLNLLLLRKFRQNLSRRAGFVIDSFGFTFCMLHTFTWNASCTFNSLHLCSTFVLMPKCSIRLTHFRSIPNENTNKRQMEIKLCVYASHFGLIRSETLHCNYDQINLLAHSYSYTLHGLWIWFAYMRK